MSLFSEREQALEAKFAHDEELRFKMMVRRSRLFADWVAQQLALTGAAATDYAGRMTEALFRPGGQYDLVGQALADLTAVGSAVTRAEIAVAFERCERVAKQQIVAEQQRP